MTGALVLALALTAAYAWRLRRAMRRAAICAATAQARLVVARNVERERADAAERRLGAARDLMLSVAEGVAADAAKRTAVAYAPPVRALPRTPVSVPAPACPVCARHEVAVAIVRASRAPVATITGESGWHPPFVVRWADA